jgi:hypothetical protein
LEDRGYLIFWSSYEDGAAVISTDRDVGADE